MGFDIEQVFRICGLNQDHDVNLTEVKLIPFQFTLRNIFI